MEIGRTGENMKIMKREREELDKLVRNHEGHKN